MIQILKRQRLFRLSKTLSIYAVLFLCGYLTQVVRAQGISGNLAMVDPNLYLGYAHIGSSLYRGIGETYYQHRIAWIFPLRISMMFGDSGPIYLMRSLAGLIPVISFYFLSKIIEKLNFFVALGFGLAIICMSPIQTILSQTYTAAASFVFLFLLIAHVTMLAQGTSTNKLQCLVGFEIATLFSIHEFNLVLIVFIFIFANLFLVSINRSRSSLIAIAKMNLTITGFALLGLFLWEIVYNFHYRIFRSPESFVYSSFRISHELTRLHRWDSYPDFFETLNQNQKWLHLFIPIIIGSAATIAFVRSLVSKSTRPQTLLAITASQFFAMLVSAQILHAPIFSESFYFALTLLILVPFSLFAIASLQRQRIALVFWVFPFLSILNSTLIFNVTKFIIRLDIGHFLGFNFDLLIWIIIPLVTAFTLVIFSDRRFDLITFSLAIICWIPAAAGIENAYLLNSYKQNIGMQSNYLSDVKDLTELWSVQDQSGITAVWNDADSYLEPLQTSLMFGGTRLQGLGNSSNFPSLDNWNCGRFWGSRWVSDSCVVNGRNLADRPRTIITIHRALNIHGLKFDQVVAPWFSSELNSIGYSFKSWGVFRTHDVAYVLWSK